MSLAGRTATAQSPGMQKQLDRIDIGVSGDGEFTTSVSGTNYLHTPVVDSPSTTLQALGTIRYTKSKYLGFEGNLSYGRFVQNYTNYVPGGVQARADEYSLGYVVHPKVILGLDTFAGVGLGTIGFKPTPGGGQGLSTQARMEYYYTVGVDDYFPEYHLGLRAAFRQKVFLAPDFGQNYLTITRRAITSEPTVGFFLRF